MHAFSSARFAQHKAHKFMWGTAIDGQSFDTIVTTLHNSQGLHSGTRDGVPVPIHGFLMNGTLFLDPAGVLCEPAGGQAQRRSPRALSSSDNAFLHDYEEALEAWGNDADRAGTRDRVSCNIGGRLIHGVSPVAASRLSAHLWHEARPFVERPAARGGSSIAGRMRRAVNILSAGSVTALHPSDCNSSTASKRPVLPSAAVDRVLAKSSITQSAGVRAMLIARVVWSDQNSSDALPLSSFLNIANGFVQWANNASYGNMVSSAIL